MTIALKFVIKCEVFGFEENFQGIFLAMFFLKHVNMLLLTKKIAKISSLF
jgi:type IV secretory pathway VirB4 component